MRGLSPSRVVRRRMCNLYSITSAQQHVLDLFKVGHNRSVGWKALPAIFPGHVAPIVRVADDDERELITMNWGFILLRPGYAPKRVTNTRDDKLMGRFWRSSFEARRCLVPASSFCEPNDGRAAGTPATWHWFALRGDEPRPPFAFAGIWQRWHGPVKKDGPNVEQDVYSFMTTVPNELTLKINHERSPVLLTTPEEHEVWLRGSSDEAVSLVRPIEAERLVIVQAGTDKMDRLGKPEPKLSSLL